MLELVAYPQSWQLLQEALQGCMSHRAEVDDVMDFIIPEILIKCLLCARHHVGAEGMDRWAQWEGGHAMWLTELCEEW